MEMLRSRGPRPSAPRHTACDTTPRTALGAVLFALACVACGSTRAESLVLMPNLLAPEARKNPSLLLGRLNALAGTEMTLVGTTRTGAWRLTTPDAGVDSAAIARLRNDRAVLWVDVSPAVAPSLKPRTKSAGPRDGQKLMVRLRDDVAADWPTLTARFAATLGTGVTVERQIANVWVLRLATPQRADTLVELAALLQNDPAVQYADPVLRRFAQMQAAPPDDPYFGDQWNLTDPLSGIDIAAAWNLQQGTAPITVAVVDTGILPHPDLDGKVLPGYDFISDPEQARDGTGRDADPRDEGDWTDSGDCGGLPAAGSSWHGTFVAGLIAAATNNGIGIAGVNANARILPVRALGHCGGTDEDIFEAMLWAAGAPIAGVPPNPNPAKVINLSLGGYGACAQSIQEAVNDAMAHGAIVVAAAGNASDDVSSFAPANCSGVITVGAHNRSGERSFYSNFGRRIDVSAPAGDGGSADSIVSVSNAGGTTPGDASYGHGIGTSFSAPLVAGTASLMLGRNPLLTAGQVLSVLQGTARAFSGTSPCRLGNLCGVGMLDAGLALASTMPAAEAAPDGSVAVIEYYNAVLDHYFITADPAEIATLDAGTAFQRTGYLFYAYLDPTHAPADALPVCRFYAAAGQVIDSHFFTANAAECDFVQRNWAGTWNLETPAAFYVQVPDAAGNCPDHTQPVYRFFNGRRDANHRYSLDLSVRRGMVNRAWVPDGAGNNGAAFCSPT